MMNNKECYAIVHKYYSFWAFLNAELCYEIVGIYDNKEIAKEELDRLRLKHYDESNESKYYLKTCKYYETN